MSWEIRVSPDLPSNLATSETHEENKDSAHCDKPPSPERQG